MKLYVFNPDADMALGNNEENYMAPASIRCMAEDLALLPAWYAQPGSGVLAPSAYNADYLKQMQRLFSLPVQLVTEPELSDYAEVQVMPWGWNPAIRKRVLKGGVRDDKLPTLQQLAFFRKIAGRDFASRLLGLFKYMDDCCGGGRVLSSALECEQYIRQHGPCVFKSLWSGSGKGLWWCRNGFGKPVYDWCSRVLAEQGGLIGMPIYNKVLDFAMEFYSNGRGRAVFAGYSLFTTNDKGGYMGNRLLRNKSIERCIEQYVSLASLVKIREYLQKLLGVFYIGHTGYLGVDMMVCLSEKTQSYAIFPCVEVNMRMNMGVVSRLFFDNFMLPSATGTFCVEAFSTHAELQEAHENDNLNFPAVVRDGKLLSGYLSLAPVTPKSRYRAYVKVEE